MADHLIFSEKANIREIYEYFIETPDFLEGFSMQVFILKDFFDNVPSEFQQEPLIGYIEPNGKTGVCFIRETENIIELFSEIINGKNVNVFEVDSILDVTGIPASTSVSAKRLLEIYKHALIISKDLNVPVPVISIVTPHDIVVGEETCFFDDDDNCVGIIISLLLQGTKKTICNLAHEMRHCWQKIHGKGYYYEQYQDYWEIGEDYAYQKEEIDAKAYSWLYMDSLGYEGENIEFDDMETKMSWKDHIELVKKRMEEIKNQK